MCFSQLCVAMTKRHGDNSTEEGKFIWNSWLQKSESIHGKLDCTNLKVREHIMVEELGNGNLLPSGWSQEAERESSTHQGKI